MKPLTIWAPASRGIMGHLTHEEVISVAGEEMISPTEEEEFRVIIEACERARRTRVLPALGESLDPLAFVWTDIWFPKRR